jgi:hypothetical protein
MKTFMKKEMLNLHVSPVGNDRWSGHAGRCVLNNTDHTKPCDHVRKRFIAILCQIVLISAMVTGFSSSAWAGEAFRTDSKK